MHIDKFKYPISIEEAVEKIKLNQSRSFIWFPVINIFENKFSLGGNYQELKAIIPKYNENKDIVVYSNDFSMGNFSITTGSCHPNDGITTSKENLLKLIKKDLTKVKIEKEEIEVIEYDTKITYKFK